MYRVAVVFITLTSATVMTTPTIPGPGQAAAAEEETRPAALAGARGLARPPPRPPRPPRTRAVGRRRPRPRGGARRGGRGRPAGSRPPPGMDVASLCGIDRSPAESHESLSIFGLIFTGIPVRLITSFFDINLKGLFYSIAAKLLFWCY